MPRDDSERRSTPTGETLRNEGPPPGPVTVLVTECLDVLQTEGEAGVDAICRAHPEHADAVRRRLDRLQRVGLWAAAAAAPPPPAEAAAGPERLGEYQLLRPLGGGGMGVVYLARQEPLGRTVALKLIRPNL